MSDAVKVAIIVAITVVISAVILGNALRPQPVCGNPYDGGYVPVGCERRSEFWDPVQP